MKLELENFRCYDRASFDLGNSGITLISGPSGVGKSTCCMAIYFALYGKGSKLKKKGAKHSKVCLVTNELVIERTITPNRLVVTEGSRVVEDGEAQECIYRHFGTKFDVVGYIQQSDQNSFLQMTPEKKLVFFESLLFQTINPHALRQETKKVLQQREKEYTRVQAKLEQVDATLSTFSSSLNPSKNRETLQQEFDRLQEECKIIKDAIETMKERKAKQDVMKCRYENAQRDKEIIQIKNNKLLQQITDYEKELHDLEVMQQGIEKEFVSLEQVRLMVMERMKQNHDYREYMNKKHRATEIEEELWADYSASDVESQLEVLQELRNDFLRHQKLLSSVIDTTSLDETLQDLYKQMHDMEDRVLGFSNCPSCQEVLAIQGKKLMIKTNRHSVATIDEEEHSKIKQTIESVRVDIQENNRRQEEIKDLLQHIEEIIPIDELSLSWIKDEVDYFQSYYQRMRQYEQYLEEFQATPVVECPEDISQLQDIVKTLEESSRKIDQLTHTLVVYKQQEKDNQSTLSTLTDVMEKNSTFSDENLVKVIDEMTERNDMYQSQSSKLIQEIAAAEHYEQYMLLVSQQKSLEQERQHLEKQVLAARQMIELIRTSEGIVLKQSVDQLNVEVALFLDRLFVDDPINVRIDLFSESKTKGLQLKLNMFIEYKNMECDWTMLSGGEQSRVNLAFTLAFARLLNSPLILLDECTSHLDQELTGIVIETIQDIFQDCLVVVIAHQVVTGTFDRVLKLNK